MTLAEVIDRARHEWCVTYLEAWRKPVPPTPTPTQSEHIAAAVAAHMLSDAVVERAAQAMWPDDPVTEEDVSITRAAIAAALADAPARAREGATTGDGQ